MADSHLTIFHLPSDILCDIFEFLPREDLIQLTTVCKLFNNVISHSSKLLIKLPVDVSRSSLRLWTASREYNNLIVPSDNFKRRMSIIESLTESIVRLKIEGNSWRHKRNPDIDNLLELLEKMPKLRHLDINLHSNFETRLIGKNLALKLDTLNGYLSENIFPLFFNCSVKCFGTGPSNNEAFIEFLKRQRDLQQLTTYCFDPTNSLTIVNFKLKKLNLRLSCTPNMGDAVKLLLKFQESLECLELGKIDEQVMRILPTFDKLKTLNITSNWSSLKGYEDIVLSNIENVSINGNMEVNSHLTFPNLKHLTLRDPSYTNAIKNLTKLESLKIYGTEFIHRSTAKKLMLIHNNYYTRPFDYNDNDFEEIFVIKYEEKQLEWLDEFIEGGFAARLKTFNVTQIKNAKCHKDEDEEDV